VSLVTGRAKIGFYLPKDTRDKIYRRLAEYDAESIPKRSLKTKTPDARHAP
jgi:hypothetical protein